MSKLKAGDVVQVLNTEGFYAWSDGREQANNFLYSIGVVINPNDEGNPPVEVEIVKTDEDYGYPLCWYFYEHNLNKIGVL